MKILAIEREIPGATEERMKPFLKAEAAQVWELYQAGVIRELYFRADHHSAIIVLECASLREAKQTLDQLPLVSQGFITFEVIPLIPYPGFGRLFEV